MIENPLKHIIIILSSILLLGACSSLDCPMNNLVYTNYKLLKADGTPDTLRDTITIITTQNTGNDVVVLNRAVNISSFILPISYAADRDTFYALISDTLHNVKGDMFVVSKKSSPHFESIECSPSYFHHITEVEHTQETIDSIVINTPEVTYDTSKEHLYIYFKHRR